MEYYDGIILKPELSEETLRHYGVKGMKWGVRRYEEKGGTKTRKRLKKYRDAESRYQRAKDNYSTSMTRFDRGRYKNEMKTAKRDMKYQRTKVKEAYLADQGKELYSHNVRINDNARKVATASAAVAIATKILSAGLQSNMVPADVQLKLIKPVHTPLGDMPLSDIITITAGTSAATALAVDKIYKSNQNKKLRAYYSYTDRD